MVEESVVPSGYVSGISNQGNVWIITNTLKDTPETPAPNTPDTTDKPGAPNAPKNTPQTGDTARLSLWITLSLLAAAGSICLLFTGKQKTKGKRRMK